MEVVYRQTKKLASVLKGFARITYRLSENKGAQLTEDSSSSVVLTSPPGSDDKSSI